MTPTDKVLSVSLRPRSLEFLIGHKKLITALRIQMSTRPPGAILLSGAPGTGKTTLARILALSFQCTHQEIWGRPCDTCWANWDEFAIHEPVYETWGVQEAGEMIRLSKFDPMPPSLKRVIILDECQRLSEHAQRLLLKPTEDVPPNLIWIFASSDPSKLSAAIQRRFTSYAMEGMVTTERVQFLLKRAAKHVSFTKPFEDLVTQLSRAEITSPGFILAAFEHYISGQTAVEAVAAVLHASSGKTDTYGLCKSIISGDWNASRVLLAVAVPEEARFIRASICGYLKGALMRENNPARLEKLALAIRTLMGTSPMDDASLWPWLLASLCVACRQLK